MRSRQTSFGNPVLASLRPCVPPPPGHQGLDRRAIGNACFPGSHDPSNWVCVGLGRPFLLQILGKSSGATAAAIFFFARIAHVVVYTLSIPYLRTPAFSVSWLTCLYLLWQVFGGTPAA